MVARDITPVGVDPYARFPGARTRLRLRGAHGRDTRRAGRRTARRHGARDPDRDRNRRSNLVRTGAAMSTTPDLAFDPPLHAPLHRRVRRASADGATLPVIDPSTEAVLAHVSAGGDADVEHAVQAASRAFAGWKRTTGATRAALLRDRARRRRTPHAARHPAVAQQWQAVRRSRNRRRGRDRHLRLLREPRGAPRHRRRNRDRAARCRPSRVDPA